MLVMTGIDIKVLSLLCLRLGKYHFVSYFLLNLDILHREDIGRRRDQAQDGTSLRDPHMESSLAAAMRNLVDSHVQKG